MSDNTHEVEPAGAEEPIPNPGLAEHHKRYTDIDEAAERRVERQVSALFGLASVLALGFCVAYFIVDPGLTSVIFGFNASNFWLGMTLGLALLFIGIGAIQWAKRLMADVELVEERHPAASSPEDRAVVLSQLAAGTEESGIARRTMIRNSLLGALGVLGLPVVVLLRDLGPLPGDKSEHTVWAPGVRVVNDVTGEPIKTDDVQIGQLVNAEPALFFPTKKPDGSEAPAQYEGVALQNERAKAAVIVVRMQLDDINASPDRANWDVDGILCFSKICTHVGCPISLWEQQTHHLLCPCHQSTFDLGDNGKVIFGPAARSLPQLPLGVDDEGYLIAMSDFLEPVGPSYWERG
jgi:quinol---cytochrome c reductase iron-sulfur subunit